MQSAAGRVLERYVAAKDGNRPELASQVFAPGVTLTYSIATDAIAFPARTEGIEAVTETLISGFGLRFDRCRTYYVCDALREDAGGVPFVPWLVVMRETAVKNLRIGKGYYRWRLTAPAATGERLACALHIHIERMDPVPDPDGELLEAIHTSLPYPWLAPALLRQCFPALIRKNPRLSFLDGFDTPLASPA